MGSLLDKLKFNKKRGEIQSYSEVTMDSFSLGLMKDLRRQVEEMSFRLNNLEKTLEERLPAKVSTESKPGIPIQKIEDDHSTSIENELGLTEVKRIETIKFVLKQHNMLSSLQLAQLLHMSRTRANEYFKQMEKLEIVEPVLIGREKFYKLKNQTSQLNSNT